MSATTETRTCARWEFERNTLLTQYHHLTDEDVARRYLHHTWFCTECNTGSWRPPTGLPRDPHQVIED